MKTKVVRFKPLFVKQQNGDEEFSSDNFDENIKIDRYEVVGLRRIVSNSDNILPTDQEWETVKTLVPDAKSIGLVDRYHDGTAIIYFTTRDSIFYDGFVKISQERRA